jgi:hypothetical protein
MQQITEKQQKNIDNARTFIQELAAVQDIYYTRLITKLNLSNKLQEDFLFDYVFNSGKEETFTEYLGRHGF